MDYLLRDAHFAGVRYGLFDLDKVIDVCQRYGRGSESYLVVKLVVKEEGMFAVEQLVLAKQYVTQQVYAHRVRTVTDLMVVRGLELAIEDGNEEVKRLFSYDGSKEFLNYYLRFDDDGLRTLVMDDPHPRASSLFGRLVRRRLYKQVALIHLDELRVPDSITRGQLLNLDSAGLYELEQRVASLVACEPWEVIAHKKSVRHPAYQERGGLEPEAIHVLSRDGTPRMMSEFPDLISPHMPRVERLHVIAPIQRERMTSRGEQQEAAQRMEQEITKLIFEYVGGAG